MILRAVGSIVVLGTIAIIGEAVYVAGRRLTPDFDFRNRIKRPASPDQHDAEISHQAQQLARSSTSLRRIDSEQMIALPNDGELKVE